MAAQAFPDIQVVGGRQWSWCEGYQFDKHEWRDVPVGETPAALLLKTRFLTQPNLETSLSILKGAPRVEFNAFT